MLATPTMATSPKEDGATRRILSHHATRRPRGLRRTRGALLRRRSRASLRNRKGGFLFGRRGSGGWKSVNLSLPGGAPSAAAPAVGAPRRRGAGPLARVQCGRGGRAHGRTISWQPCPKVSGYLCGTLQVPLDYAAPSRGSVHLAVMERPVAQSKGVIVFNPGGPGESGDLILPILASLMPPAVEAKFTFVSFDERGTGSSDPLLCGPSAAAAGQRHRRDGSGHADLRRPRALLSGPTPRACSRP